MTDPGDGQPLRARVRTMQIICLALVLGVVAFLAVAGYLVLSRGQGLNPPAGIPYLSIMALVMLLTNGPLAVILPGVMTRTAVQKIAAGTWTPPAADQPEDLDDSTKLLAVRQMSFLIGQALWESVGFMGAMAYLQEGDPLVLTVAGVSILFMLGSMPTVAGVQSWLDRQQDLLAESRQRR